MFSLFDGYVIRSTLLDQRGFFRSFDAEELIPMWTDNPRFMAALAHANPFIYHRLKELETGRQLPPKELERIVQTVFNYWHRAHFDTTPYGLLASVGYVPAISGDANATTARKPYTAVSLDLGTLHLLVGKLDNTPDVFRWFKLYANNSIYRLDGQLRYTEKRVDAERGIANFELSSAEDTEALALLLDYCEDGRMLDEIIAKFSDLGATPEAVTAFTHDLLENQLLIAEYHTVLVGEAPFPAFVRCVDEALMAAGDSAEVPFLKSFSSGLHQLQEVLSTLSAQRPGEITAEIIRQAVRSVVELIGNLTGRSVDEKKILHLDTFSAEATADSKIPPQALDQLLFVINQLGALSNFPSSLDGLRTFRKAFKAKYGSRIVPLAHALDSDVGISYGTFTYQEENILVNTGTPERSNRNVSGKIIDYLDELRLLLYRHIVHAVKKGKTSVELSAKDLTNPQQPVLTDCFNQSIQAIVREHHLDGRRKFFLYSFGNASGGNLIARFAYGNPDIERLLTDVFEYEAGAAGESVVAEIIHLSEPRLGNITQKSVSRDTEIPLITRSVKPTEQQLPLDDLYVAVVGDEVVLFSGRLRKRVIPKLTNAHNYNRNTIPVYQFLGDLSYQNNVANVELSLGKMRSAFPYLPRVSYGDVVLIKKTWFIPAQALQKLHDEVVRGATAAVSSFLDRYRIDPIVELVTNEQRLIIDWQNSFLLGRLLAAINANESVRFEETFGVDALNGQASSFNREYVLPLKNSVNRTNRAKYAFNKSTVKGGLAASLYPGDGCLYVKLYCSRSAYPEFLSLVGELMVTLRQQSVPTLCFFLPYNDGDFHIRLRVLSAEPFPPTVRKITDEFIQRLRSRMALNRIVYDTYERELDRYNQDGVLLAEELFALDSAVFARFRADTSIQAATVDHYLPLIATRTIDCILDTFSLGVEEKFRFLTHLKEAYFGEFGVEGRKDPLYQDLIAQERTLRPLLDHQPLNEKIGPSVSNALAAALAEYATAATAEVASYRGRGGKVTSSLVAGIVHMHMIRLFPSAPRKNELYVYYLLYCRYKKAYHKMVAAARRSVPVDEGIC